MLAPLKLAWRQLALQRSRLVVALAGVVFAVVLMLMQLGFRTALFESAVASTPNEVPSVKRPAMWMRWSLSSSAIGAEEPLTRSMIGAYSGREARSKSTASGRLRSGSCAFTSGRSKTVSSGGKPTTSTLRVPACASLKTPRLV